MEVLRKQASKFREQVAKQQQAVLKQFSGRFTHDSSIVDDAELECHQKLRMLYNSTRAAKHLQRDIVRGVEGFIAVSTKQMEIVKKLADDCCKYGNEFQTFGFALAKASLNFGASHKLMEKERENLLKILGEQVFDPLRAMIMGAPLEDARLLTYRYERIRQDVETQTAEVIKRHLKAKEGGASADSAVRLQHAESKLSELKTSLSALGREAMAAMLAVEDQQQQITFQRLLVMVDAERAYHQNVADILKDLHAEMVLAKEHNESTSLSTISENDMHSQTVDEDPQAVHGDPQTVNEDPQPVNGDPQTVNEDPQPVDGDPQTVNEDPQHVNGDPQPRNGDPQTVNEDPQTVNEDPQIVNEDPKSRQSGDVPANGQNDMYFVAEVVHPFDASPGDGELSLSVGDYVVVRKVTQNGWAEGECKGKAGWFPSAYIERRDKAPASKVIEPRLLT